MKSSRLAWSKVSAVALILASLALSGCSSTGSLNIIDPPLPPPPPPPPPVVLQSAIGLLATNTGTKATSVGGVISTAGSSIASTETESLGIDNGVMKGLGGAVEQTGNAVDILGTGTDNSFGKIAKEDANNTDQAEADILALKLDSAPLIMKEIGGAVSSVGDAVEAVDNGQLSALSPVTAPAGALLNETGAGIASLSSSMSTALDNAVVQQVTSSGSTMIHMIAIDVETATESLGASTGLGAPVNDLLDGAGLTVMQLGNNIATTFAASPVLASTGAVVSSAGTLVTNLGGLVTPPATSKTAP
jgi:hypothetical protein